MPGPHPPIAFTCRPVSPRASAAAAASVIWIALSGCDAPPPSTSTQARPPQTTESTSPDPAPDDAPEEPAPPSLAPADAPSPLLPLSLVELRGRIEAPVRAAARAAPGVRSRPRLGNTGRTYEIQVLAAEAASPIEMVGAAIEGLLEPAPEPFNMGYYQDVEPIEDVDAATIEAALRFERPAFPETEREPEARAALAAALQREAASPAARGRAFFARAGWADADGQSRHGVAFADPATGQVLWVYVMEIWAP